MFLVSVILAVPMQLFMSEATAAENKKLVYDDAGLLSQEDYEALNVMANQYGAKRQTDFIIVTSKDTGNVDVVKMTDDFYDKQAPGYDKPHGNAAILMLDMKNREVYLAGFYKGKQYLDDKRLDQLRAKITPKLTSGQYRQAFETYIQTAYKYMGVRPGVNPDNILFNLWFQLGASLVLGGAVVGTMAYHSGGRVTVQRQTYEDASTSGVLDHQDQYLRTTTSRRKIEKNNNGGGSGGGGGGGTTGGGHSHSGSRGSF
ncbi:TPM domain-containing protein [Paenibacillus filicis]